MHSALARLPAVYKLPIMNTYKFNLLRNFVSEVKTANDGMQAMQNAILEAIDVIEDGDEALGDSKPIADAEDTAGVEIQWATLQDSLKALAGDGEAEDMQVILRNNSGDTYLFFKKGKVDFVATASGEEKAEANEPKSKFLGKEGY
jgi:hypothetical protein